MKNDDDEFNQRDTNDGVNDPNITFTDDIDNFSNEEVLILNENDTVVDATQTFNDNNVCCLDETSIECEHRKEIKTLKKKMISILKDHSYTNHNVTKPTEISSSSQNERTDYQTTNNEKENVTDVNDYSDNDLVEYIDESFETEDRSEMGDVEDQIVTNEIKLEILNAEDLKEEVDKLRKEILILKKLLIEKERIIDSQEKYILLLENRR